MTVKEKALSATTDTMADVGQQNNVKVTTDTVSPDRQTYQHTAQLDMATSHAKQQRHRSAANLRVSEILLI